MQRHDGRRTPGSRLRPVAGLPHSGRAAHTRRPAQSVGAGTAHGRRETGPERNVGLGNPRKLRRPLQRSSRSHGKFINIAASLKGTVPYQPGVADLVKKRTAAQDLDPNVHCMPRGAPRIWTDDYYKRIFQVPDRVIILTERNMQYRQIFTDGRPLPTDPNPTWNGYSTARWEGDTLVVQTTGFKDDLWLDASGHPLSSAGKLTERIRRPNYGTLEVEMTIDDPKSYTAPWTVTLRQPLALDSELLDYYCLENEKSWAHMVK